MKKIQPDIMDLFNSFEDIRFKLNFMEAALRRMTESKIIDEPGISEGISSIFNSIIQEHKIITKQFHEIALPSNNATEE